MWTLNPVMNVLKNDTQKTCRESDMKTETAILVLWPQVREKRGGNVSKGNRYWSDEATSQEMSTATIS